MASKDVCFPFSSVLFSSASSLCPFSLLLREGDSDTDRAGAFFARSHACVCVDAFALLFL